MPNDQITIVLSRELVAAILKALLDVPLNRITPDQEHALGTIQKQARLDPNWLEDYLQYWQRPLPEDLQYGGK